MSTCRYCGSIWKNNSILSNHSRYCKDNPNPIKKSGKTGNQWTKAKETGDEYIMSDETRSKFVENAKNRSFSDKTRKKMSISASKRNLGGVRQSKCIEYKGKKLGSTYEYRLILDLEENNIEWETCDRMSYVDLTGKKRTYTPDIYLPFYNVYLDPKNDFLINNINPKLGFKDIDKIKWVSDQNNVRILILDKTQLTWLSIKQLLPLYP